MRFALLSLFVSAAVCFTVPANQPAGVYMVTYNADGTETHALLSLTETNGTIPAATARSATPSAKFGASKRQISGGTNTIFCGGRDFYSIAGCTVAYFCNYRDTADTCFQYEWVNVIQNAVTPTCGSYWTGWDQFNSEARQNQYGYENLCGAGNNYCGRGTNGR
ncbi:hypothetical protein DFH07DRAFT_760708 [Mycena maculata]|uniref:Uncharacterized protein n=1 Tax=Mycena maculata TaxID=230809 RepID=A0AAD7HHJ2_9AGAR|nr:hypothetical protein DFH07DRAFT_760708 [Mycena maculata]